MKKHLINLLYVLCIFNACNKKEEYKITESGLKYKIKSIGDGKLTPQPNDYLKLNLTLLKTEDSLLLDTSIVIEYKRPTFKGSFEEVLAQQVEGDVYSYIQNIDSLLVYVLKRKKFHALNNPLIKLDVRLIKILKPEEAQQAVKELKEDLDIEEQRIITKYVKTLNGNYTKLNNGMYYNIEKKGSGEVAKKGNAVKIEYCGRFISGEIFDSLRTMDFTLGDKYQVIDGLEYAISLMKKSEKAKFIIPSYLAYGEKGSSTGVVPPYTTVIYSVTLINIKQ